ncbi:PiggyBac transposable element-derived protein 4 [Plakobranchus ocellatus]|uniref:PiggyBac transposable element-derived protein 4 n=1 Tax=Plakobranchus ocellatus TaxID=259542 RepID=A0AAV3YDG7_9GAST|nr:PiggyBac transposable element-derived protein 4 [Plakobranchus ocellatus]
MRSRSMLLLALLVNLDLHLVLTILPQTSTEPLANLDLDCDEDGYEYLEADNGKYMYDWCKNLENFPVVPPFTDQTGFQFDDTDADITTPLGLFSLFISRDILKRIKSETNRYAESVIREKERRNVPMSPRSIFKTWTTVTVPELYTFLAISFHMALVPKSKLKDYWSTDISVKTLFALKLMKKKRFLSILSFFHLKDNTTVVPG